VTGWPVHVVIVAFGPPAALDRSIAALRSDRPATCELNVTVVDNSSSPDVAAIAERHGVTYIDSGSNRGFAGGVNLAVGRLPADEHDVLLLNPDAVITPAGVAELEAFLHHPHRERVAAVAPLLRDEDGEEQRVLWPFPSPLRMWAEAVGLGRLPARGSFVVGAAVLLRREALTDVGSFDERFFLYAEETDWQRRARKLGWRCAVCPDVHVEHVGAGTSTDERRREVLFHAAQETYIRKWYGGAGWAAYRVAASAGAVGRALALDGERRAQATRRALLYLRGPRRVAARSR
jgi:GT2 family glycosyltransferase